MTTAAAPIVSAPLVWVELITSSVERASHFYGSLLGWKPWATPRSTDSVVYLDQARMAGPICGIRPRSQSDPIPAGVVGTIPDRWSVRLSPPRPPAAADPGGDQLLRPRSPGPRLGRWGTPGALCYAELRTLDVDGAQLWIERRLDGVFTAVDGGARQLGSSVDPGRPVVLVVPESDASQAGWFPCIQVARLAPTLEGATAAGARSITERAVPTGCVGTAAAEVVDSGGATVVLVEHGPVHGRRG